MVVRYTNKRIQFARQPFQHFSSFFLFFTRDTDKIELCAFFDLIYIRGFEGKNNHDLNHLYDPIIGAPPSGATTSKNRFKFLFTCVSFDDFDTREQKWKHDRFAAMRDLFELFNKNGSTVIVPKKYFLCIGETPHKTKLFLGNTTHQNLQNTVCSLSL